MTALVMRYGISQLRFERALPPSRVHAFDLEVQDLARRRRQRTSALDRQEGSLSPHESHDAFGVGPAANALQECGRDLGRIESADPWMDEEPEPRSAVGSLLLDELVVDRATAEPCGEGFLEHADEVRVEECHSASGELLVAPDGVKWGGPAESLQRAPASALGANGFVPERHVQQYEGSLFGQGGDQERAGPRTSDLACLRLDDREEVMEEVDVVGLLGGQA